MSESLLHRTLEIYERLMELPEARRDHALREQCGRDAQLEAEVSALLEAEHVAPDYFAGLSERLGICALFQDESKLPLPERIGPYRVVRLIGYGGMGAVYLAEREGAGFEQRVAIKVLPLSLAGTEARARFRAERQILAQLQHPNVAALYDGGVTEEATLYFVMEYVKGSPIDQACDERRLGIEERIALFLQVCDAVSYAHRNLIVHRDLKPANILVDDDGRVRLLDFGIAKMLGEDAVGPLTRAGGHRMTPRYASPELVRGESPTTASDVYSLGVLLHELLTGRSPYRGRPTTEIDFARAIAEHHLGLASELVDQDDADVSIDALAHSRSTTPRQLRRRLQGDIDAILAKAMEKDPDQRYSTVEDLADDLRRHLGSEPIRAHTPRAIIRVRKFVRRHRAGVTAASISALALVALVVTSVMYAVNTKSQSLAIQAERERAEQIRDFLLSVFEVSDPNASKGESITARELLDRGAEKVRGDLEAQPRTRAMLMETIASVYDRLSLYDRADAQFAEALTIIENAGMESSDEYARITLGRASMLERRGNYDEALSYAQSAREYYRRNGRVTGLVQTSLLIGRLHHRLGDIDAAEDFYRQALEGSDGLEGEDRLLAAEAWTVMGTLMVEREDFATARRFHEDALAIRKELLGDDLSLIESYYNLGLVARRQGRLEEAKRYYVDALDLTSRLVPDGHADDAFMLNGLAFVHRDLGELEPAARRFAEAVEISKRFVGERHPFVGMNLGNLGGVRLEQGRLALADSLLSEALQILEESVPNHPIAARVRSDLGRCLFEQGRFAEAEPVLRDAYASAVEAHGSGHETPRQVAGRLAELFAATSDTEQARVWTKRSETTDVQP